MIARFLEHFTRAFLYEEIMLDRFYNTRQNHYRDGSKMRIRMKPAQKLPAGFPAELQVRDD